MATLEDLQTGVDNLVVAIHKLADDLPDDGAGIVEDMLRIEIKALNALYLHFLNDGTSLEARLALDRIIVAKTAAIVAISMNRKPHQ